MTSDRQDRVILEARNLNVRLETSRGSLHVVRRLDLEVSSGETVCIVGESGCGKSMTSLALMDILPRSGTRTADRLTFEGKDILSAGERAMSRIRGDRMSMIFQEPMTTLNPVYTIGDQLTEPLLRHRNISRREAYKKAEEMLEKVGISGAARRLGQYPHQLSGGLRQRVIIAMALICNPSLVIADEPTTALDVTIQAQILWVLKNLQKELGMGMIFITHDLGLVSRIADRVLVMYAGKIVEQGSVRDVFRNPRHPYTQGLLRCIPVPGMTNVGARLGSIPGVVPSLFEKINGCGFRTRCPRAMEACSAGEIPLRQSASGHLDRCLLPESEVGRVWSDNDQLETLEGAVR